VRRYLKENKYRSADTDFIDWRASRYPGLRNPFVSRLFGPLTAGSHCRYEDYGADTSYYYPEDRVHRASSLDGIWRDSLQHLSRIGLDRAGNQPGDAVISGGTGGAAATVILDPLLFSLWVPYEWAIRGLPFWWA